MSKKISLEDKFTKAIGTNKISYTSKIFNIGEKLYLPDFVFDHFIVEVLEELTPRKLLAIKEFKASSSGYKIVLLTSDEKNILKGAEVFDEVFNYDSIDVLIAEIKKNLN